MSVTEHRARAARTSPVTAFVVTVSDTRTLETDTSGAAIAALLEAAGHHVAGREVVPDDPARVRRAVESQLGREGVRAVITTGGTGISARDSTYEALASLFEKRLDGFGEIFRQLSYAEIGAAAMLSRASAGTVGAHVIFVLPGSEHAVRLAMERLILPELSHVVYELSRHATGPAGG